MFHPTAHHDHALRELQGKRTSVAAGAAVDTDITVTGIKPGDSIGSVLMFDTGVPSAIDLAEVSITAVNTIQLSTTVSTGNQLVVEWYSHVGS